MRYPPSRDLHPLSNLQSHAFSQTYGAILPTSLTLVGSIYQRLLTLET